MAQKLRAVPLDDSDSDYLDDDESVQRRLASIRGLSDVDRRSKRFQGGIIVGTGSEDKSLSTSASMSAVEKKGRKEVAELERELDLKNTFSKETNRRDEDAEMNKYIDEQMRESNRQKRRKLAQDDNDPQTKDAHLADMFTLPASEADNIDDILLHSLSQNLASGRDERNEAMLSSQMLNGIPEVDLGIDEKIRTIESTEEAKLKMSLGTSRNNKKHSTAPRNYSSNFQHHRGHNRDSRDGLAKSSKDHNNRDTKTVSEPVVVVGEEPDEVECKVPQTGERPPHRGKASDDYHLSKFRRYNRK